MIDEIETFRDCKLRGPIARRPELREALIAAGVGLWRVDLDRSTDVANYSVGSPDVLCFRREKDVDFPASGLTLWSTDDGYYVPNIVPLESGSLSIAQYNALLSDFIARVVEPIAARYGYTIETTKARQTIDDWLSPDAAKKLQQFSRAANKSTRAGHPKDEGRWFDFIIAAHLAGDKLASDLLARWLSEAEGWDEESAHRLAGDYETSLALLSRYDQLRD